MCDIDTLAVCSKCKNGFNLYLQNSKLSCLQIPSLIHKCELVSLNQSYCYQCADYYYFDPIQLSCLPYNASCTDPLCKYCPVLNTTATGCQCVSGFAYDLFTKSCGINTFGDDCLQIGQYGSQLICYKCADGLILSNDFSSCVTECSAANCTTCFDAYNEYCKVCD